MGVCMCMCVCVSVSVPEETNGLVFRQKRRRCERMFREGEYLIVLLLYTFFSGFFLIFLLFSNNI